MRGSSRPPLPATSTIAVVAGLDADAEAGEAAQHRHGVVAVGHVRQPAVAVGEGGGDEGPVGDALRAGHRHLAVHRAGGGAQPLHDSGDTAGCMPSAGEGGAVGLGGVGVDEHDGDTEVALGEVDDLEAGDVDRPRGRPA